MGYQLIGELRRAGLRINVTCMLTLRQVGEVLAEVEAATFRNSTPLILSIFAGRIADTGRDPISLMRQAATLVAQHPQVSLLWASAREALNILQAEEAGADIIGANCGAGIDVMIKLISVMRSATTLPVWCKPNAGLPELVEGKTVYRETPEMMASKLGALVQAGANIVGGCCGTTPAHIRALALERNKLASLA
jgi:5-methyltetrahydrofolate--homocysteine methyltransferase